jgi:uncharacterized tellurite resistance protein B-like protein
MPFLLAILGVLGAAAFWYYRIKYMGQAAGEIVDAAERARGAFRRRRFRKKADAATIDAIDDPRTAAAVLLVAIASADGRRMTDTQETAIKEAMRKTMGVEDPDEELVFAKWAAADVVDVTNLISRLSRVWTAKLNMAERLEFYDLARKISATEDEPDDAMLSSLQRLRDRLGLTPGPKLH